MTHEQFNQVATKTLKQLEYVLIKKGKEYSEGRGNRFHNFIQAGLKQGISKERALMGMLTKHLVSIDDMIDGHIDIDRSMIEEKLNDALVYYMILKAMLLDRRFNDIMGDTTDSTDEEFSIFINGSDHSVAHEICKSKEISSRFNDEDLDLNAQIFFDDLLEDNNKIKDLKETNEALKSDIKELKKINEQLEKDIEVLNVASLNNIKGVSNLHKIRNK